MSKSYKLTRKWRKTDWLPPSHIAYFEKNRDYENLRGYVPFTPNTKEELEELIRNTKVIAEERVCESIDWLTKKPYYRKYIYYRNRRLLEEATRKLEAILWWENNPHREADKNDYFYVSYAKNPGHWNHWTYTKRRRAHDRQVIHKIKAGVIEADEAVFYHKKKPVIYYW